MTEDQIMQRVAENQKRVFSDIDRSKPSKDSSGGFNIVGSNGVTVQGSGREAAISIDTEAIKGSSGEQGLAGDRGEQGQQGLEGEQGEAGEKGDAAAIEVGATVTLEPGSSATVANSGTSSEAILNFGIPKGDKGDEGEKGDKGDKGDNGENGVGISGVALNSDLSFTFTLTNGSEITTAPIETVSCN
jgi:hypothetical protein